MDALTAAYRRRNLLPRLEFPAAAAPEAIVDGTAEVAGIGARIVFLTPAGATEQRLYESVGYQPADDMLHLRRSPR